MALRAAYGHALNLWVFGRLRRARRVESSPAIAGGRVFVGSNDGRFYVLNLYTGAKLGSLMRELLCRHRRQSAEVASSLVPKMGGYIVLDKLNDRGKRGQAALPYLRDFQY